MHNNSQTQFKKKYGAQEDKLRFALFVDTLGQINEHNQKFAKGLVNVRANLNEYTDWTYAEKKKLLDANA